MARRADELVGAKVKLVELLEAKDLNGSISECVRFMQAKGRYEVKITRVYGFVTIESSVAVKRENLQKLENFENRGELDVADAVTTLLELTSVIDSLSNLKLGESAVIKIGEGKIDVGAAARRGAKKITIEQSKV